MLHNGGTLATVLYLRVTLLYVALRVNTSGITFVSLIDMRVEFILQILLKMGPYPQPLNLLPALPRSLFKYQHESVYICQPN